MSKARAFSFSVKGNTREIQRHLSDTERKALPKASIQALNRTGKKAHTQMVRAVAQDQGVKSKAVRKRMFFKGRLKARPGSFEAVVLFRSMEFSAAAAKRVYQTKKGVSINGRLVPGAFIVRTRSGKKQVFIRRGRSRHPIDVVDIHGDGGNTLRGRPDVDREMDRLAAQVFEPTVRREYPRELDRAMAHQLRKIQKRGRR